MAIISIIGDTVWPLHAEKRTSILTQIKLYINYKLELIYIYVHMYRGKDMHCTPLLDQLLLSEV